MENSGLNKKSCIQRTLNAIAVMLITLGWIAVIGLIVHNLSPWGILFLILLSIPFFPLIFILIILPYIPFMEIPPRRCPECGIIGHYHEEEETRADYDSNGAVIGYRKFCNSCGYKSYRRY